PMGVPVKIGVSYDSDLELVERVTLEVAREVLASVDGAVDTFEPWIWYDEFSDYSINLTVYLRVQEFYQQYPLRHELIKRLHKRYAAEGIEIPFPVQTVFWRESPGPSHPNDRSKRHPTQREIAGDGPGAPPGWRNTMRRPGP